MRHCIGGWMMLLALLPVGCAVDGTASKPGWMPTLREFWNSSPTGAAQIEVAILRLPAGDAFLEHEVWREIDEQALPLDQRLPLQANGVRLGLASSPLPVALRERLAGKDATVRRITIKGGQDHFLTFTSANRAVSFEVVQDVEVIPAGFEDALPGLSLHWGQRASGQTVLRCEPRIKHGVASRLPRPASDLSAWTVTGERPEAAYSGLAWELELERDDSLVIGTWAERPNSVGQVLFMDPAGQEGLQCLVVLRLLSGTPATSATTETGPAPLVVQSLR